MYNNVRKRNVPQQHSVQSQQNIPRQQLTQSQQNIPQHQSVQSQQNNHSENIIFYSKKCQTCINLLTNMRVENLLDYFSLVCVDNEPFPKNIKIVPTMIVASIAKPLIAKEIFDWIDQIKYINKQKEMDSKKSNENDLLGFHSFEMSSISDSYAHTDIDEPMTQSYLPCDKFHKADAIITFPEHNAKLNKNLLKLKTDELINNRTEEVNIFSKMLKDKNDKLLREVYYK